MSQSQERDEAGADLKAVVAAAFAAARGEVVTPQQRCAAARAATRLEFFSERPQSKYWRLIDAPALRARADHLERMAEHDFAEAAGPSDEERALEARLRRHPLRDPAADRWMLARAAASRAASEERSAREAASEQPASAPRDALGRTFAHRAVQDDARLTQASRRGLRDTDRLIALRRARRLAPPSAPADEMGEHGYAEAEPERQRQMRSAAQSHRVAGDRSRGDAEGETDPELADINRWHQQYHHDTEDRIRRAGRAMYGDGFAEDDFDAPPQSDPVREVHKRLSDEDNYFMRRRGHRGDPVGHRHAAVDLCLDDAECRRLGVDFNAEDEDGNDQPDPYSSPFDIVPREGTKALRDSSNDRLRRRPSAALHRNPEWQNSVNDFPQDDPRADHMAEGDDDIPFDHHSRPETVDDLEARHGHGTEAYWDALNNREANADPRHAWEIAQAAWLERERLHPEIHADSDDYAEGDGPAGHPGRGYFDPGVARRAWKGKTGLGLALRARGQNLPNDLGRAYLNLEGVEEGSPPLAPGTPPLNSPPCGGNSPHKHAEPPEDGQHWLGEPNAFGHEPRRAQYEARREAAECYRASGNLAMSRKAERAAKSGQRDDERTYPPRPFGSYAEGDPIPDDRDNSLTGHEIADARREEATRYARGGNLPMARRLRHNASDLEKETKPANAHPRAPEYADDSRGSAYAEEDDMSEQGVDLFTLPPRREFLRGYAEEEGMYDPFNPPARSEEEEAADVRAHQDRTIRNYEDYARSYDDPKRHRGEDDTVVDEHGRQVTDDYFKRRSRAEQKRADRYRTWRDTGHLPPDEADAMSEDGDIGQHFPENDGVARAYYARRRYADEARAAGNEAAARVHEQGAKQGRDVDPVHGHDHQPTAPRYPGEY